jgi:methylase of polypeptide subunit release factors
LGEPLYRTPKEVVSPHLDPDKRILDPACGSGTFLVLALRALKENLRRMGFGEGDILEIAQRNVVGVDLDPLAVLAARVNYVLTLLELLPYRKNEIEIPIYLADSILTPARAENLLDEGRLTFKTVVGDMSVPETVDSPTELAKLTDLLAEYVEAEFSPEAFVKAAAKTIQPIPGPKEEAMLRELYEKLLAHHRQGLDGIWARVIKNAFMPLFLKDFDYVVGNPPWINWESLPQGYRDESAQLWQYYGLFVHKGMDVILGKGKKDISTLMTLVALDRFLKDGGKLAFVITQSVWKTSGAAQGFRRFNLPGGKRFRIPLVEDLSSLQVFEGAATRTSIFVAQKGERVVYPVPYTYWQKTKKGKGLGFDSSLEDVLSMTRVLNFYAQPVSK